MSIHLKTKLNQCLIGLTFTLVSLSTALADPGGGGGDLGGQGGNAPEPSQWYLILAGALVLGGISYFKKRSAPQDNS